jgi:hypothetical protein
MSCREQPLSRLLPAELLRESNRRFISADELTTETAEALGRAATAIRDSNALLDVFPHCYDPANIDRKCEGFLVPRIRRQVTRGIRYSRKNMSDIRRIPHNSVKSGKDCIETFVRCFYFNMDGSMNTFRDRIPVLVNSSCYLEDEARCATFS